jgi:hypothetical protein
MTKNQLPAQKQARNNLIEYSSIGLQPYQQQAERVESMIRPEQQITKWTESAIVALQEYARTVAGISERMTKNRLMLTRSTTSQGCV